MLDRMEKTFTAKFWNNVIIEITWWGYDEASVRKHSEIGITEDGISKYVNEKMAALSYSRTDGKVS